MNDPRSEIFRNVSQDILKAIKESFVNETTYIGSTVLKLEAGSVLATVENSFDLSSAVTEKVIDATIVNYITNCTTCGNLSGSVDYKVLDMCTSNPCDNSSSQCNFTDGIIHCNCKDGFFKFIINDRTCRACEDGFHYNGNTCVRCPFGYNGLNCGDPYLLAVVVISCVLGSILLFSIIGFIVIFARSRGKNPSKGHSENPETFLMWSKPEIPKIPRAGMTKPDFPQIPRVAMTWEPGQTGVQQNGNKSLAVGWPRDNGFLASSQADSTDELLSFKSKEPSSYSYLRHGVDNPYFVGDENKKKD